jgi:hypothetical protein
VTGITYKSYNFVNKDPMIDRIRTVIEDSGVTFAWIEQESGVTSHTLRKWIYGDTRKPQAATINAVLRCLGKKLTITDINYVEDIIPTAYHSPPVRERTPNNVVAKQKLLRPPKMQYDPNDPNTWSKLGPIVGRPNSTKTPSPDPVGIKGKRVPRSVSAITPIVPGKK